MHRRSRTLGSITTFVILTSCAASPLLLAVGCDAFGASATDEPPVPSSSPESSTNSDRDISGGDGTVTTTDGGDGGDGGGSTIPLDATAAADALWNPKSCGPMGAVCKTKNCTNGVCDLAIFVTSASFDGLLGSTPSLGLPAADARCSEAAAIAGLTRPVRAWLSDLTVDAKSRFASSAGPYRLLDGTLIATKISDLIASGPQAGIVVQETGLFFTIGGQLAWTGTNADGTKGYTCSGWSKNTVETGPDNSATQGATYAVNNTTWTATQASHCLGPLHLYCLEMPP